MTLKRSAPEVFMIVVFFGLVGVLLAVVLLAVAVSIVPARGDEPQRPHSCRLLDDEQKNCAFGSCDNRTVERFGFSWAWLQSGYRREQASAKRAAASSAPAVAWRKVL